MTNATSYELNLFDSATPSNITKKTPSSTTDSINNLLPMHKYSWNVTGVNSVGKGPVSETRQFIVGECWPDVGTGNGYSIDTCYDGANYLLKDISRRANLNVGGHNGHMPDTALIKTELNSPFKVIKNADNNWVADNQKSGVNAHVNAAKVYDYLDSRFYINPVSPIYSMFQIPWASIVESQDSKCANHYVFYDPNYFEPITVQFCTGNSFSSSIDIVGHEWSHAVTEIASTRGNLGESGEAAAIKEAFSDWIGIAIKHAQPNNDNSWVINIGTYNRNIAEPHKSNPPQPEIYGGGHWINTLNCTPTVWSPPDGNDMCGAHINDGVPNKMFYLLSQGGVFNNVTVNGIGIEKAIQIAFLANMNYWKKDLIFKEARDGMIKAAQDLNYTYAGEVDQVMNAWKAVGVTETSTPGTAVAKRLIPVLTNLLLGN